MPLASLILSRVRTRMQLFLRLVVISLLMKAVNNALAATTINFDDVTVPGGDCNQSVFPGNLYATSDVLFSTGNLNTDSIALGYVVAFAKLNDNIEIANSSASSVS